LPPKRRIELNMMNWLIALYALAGVMQLYYMNFIEIEMSSLNKVFAVIFWPILFFAFVSENDHNDIHFDDNDWPNT
jgi:hypothetical protein